VFDVQSQKVVCGIFEDFPGNVIISQAFNHPSSVTASASYLIHNSSQVLRNKRYPPPLPSYSKQCCILFILLNPSDSCCGFLSKSVFKNPFFHFPASVTLTRSEYTEGRAEEAKAVEMLLPKRVSRMQVKLCDTIF